jgi:hypothetical protein
VTNARCLYREFYLSCTSELTPDGKYRAHVAITMLCADRTRSQRFIDSVGFASDAEAHEQGMALAKAWVDANELAERGRQSPTSFVPL